MDLIWIVLELLDPIKMSSADTFFASVVLVMNSANINLPILIQTSVPVPRQVNLTRPPADRLTDALLTPPPLAEPLAEAELLASAPSRAPVAGQRRHSGLAGAGGGDGRPIPFRFLGVCCLFQGFLL